MAETRHQLTLVCIFSCDVLSVSGNQSLADSFSNVYESVEVNLKNT